MSYPKQIYIPAPQVANPGSLTSNSNNNEEGFLNSIRMCNPDLCKEYISKDPEILHRKGWNNLTPLHHACLSGQVTIVQLLIENGADPNVFNSFDETPLHYACRRGVVNVVHYMINHGADSSCIDKKGRNCIHFAALNGNVCMLHYLSEFTDLNLETPDVTGKNILHIVVEMRQLPALRYLAKHNRVDPSLQDLRGVTPLHIVVEKGFEDFVWILMRAGGCELLRICNQKGDTPLSEAKKGTLPRHIQFYKMLSPYADSIGPPVGAVYTWYFLLTLPFLYGAGMFLLSFYVKGYGGHLCVLLSLFLMNILRNQTHRIEHMCRWSNPVFVGLFVGGILHCAIAEFGFLFRVIWPCMTTLLLTTILAGLCIYLLGYIIFGDPGIDVESMYCETYKRPMTMLDLANGRVNEAQFCPYTEKIHGFETKYCKLCEQPILKLDHHCLFLNTCIAMKNHRQFLILILLVMALQVSFLTASIRFMGLIGSTITDSGLGDPWSPYLIYLYKTNPWIFFLTALCVLSFIWEGTLVYAQFSVIMRGTTTYRTLKHASHNPYALSRMDMLRNVVKFFTMPKSTYSHPSMTKDGVIFNA